MSDHRGQSKARADLAAALDAQRIELRLKWTDVAARAGVSVATINRARKSGEEITQRLKVALEDALRLRRGSIDEKLAGGELTPLSDDPKIAVDHAAPLVVRMSADELAELIMSVQEDAGREAADQFLDGVKRKRAEWAAKRANPKSGGGQAQAG